MLALFNQTLSSPYYIPSVPKLCNWIQRQIVTELCTNIIILYDELRSLHSDAITAEHLKPKCSALNSLFSRFRETYCSQKCFTRLRKGANLATDAVHVNM